MTLASASNGSVIEVQVPKNMISTLGKDDVDFFTHHTVERDFDNNGDDEADKKGFVSF